MNTPAPTAPFAPTRWTLVLRAHGKTEEARAALGELCAAYYQPVLRFLRREGREEDVARELTHEFMARVLAGDGFAGADPARGRFRSYLLGALKHFLAEQRARGLRLKRGGGAVLESLDATGGTDTSPGLDVADSLAPGQAARFDREWALTVMGRALLGLEREFAAAGKSGHFQTLKPWLVGDMAIPQAEAARALGLSEGAIKVLIHRLRRRFRETVRAEIAQTVDDPAQVDEELRCLVEALV